jgi:hypothetical protein
MQDDPFLYKNNQAMYQSIILGNDYIVKDIQYELTKATNLYKLVYISSWILDQPLSCC